MTQCSLVCTSVSDYHTVYMETCSSETLVSTYQTTRYHNQENNIKNPHRCDSKSYTCTGISRLYCAPTVGIQAPEHPVKPKICGR
jgi:hypothetical protein